MRASSICTLLVASIAAASPAKLDNEDTGDKAAGVGGSIASAVADEPASQPSDDRIIIGYRSVLEGEAKAIAAADGTVVRHEAFDKIGTHPLGPGVYLSPGLGDYDALKQLAWFCEVTADKKAWDEANKAWIPRTSATGVEIPGHDAALSRYVFNLGGKDMWTTMNTIMMQPMDHRPGNFELVIPTLWVQQPISRWHPDLKLKARCENQINKFNNPPRVNWMDWTNNVRGAKPTDVTST